MRRPLIEKMKSDIEATLKKYLYEEGIELYIATNDNHDFRYTPFVELESLSDKCLEGTTLLSEIRLILGILGKPWQCQPLVNGIYEALHPHNVTHSELTVLLMSLHIESVHCVRPRHHKKRAIVKYIVETPPESAREQNNVEAEKTPSSLHSKTECCRK